MINMMIGASGGGKSYETVVYHILPALKAGRMVITNLPVFVEEICKIDATYRDLIVLRNKSKDPTAKYPFSVVQDYEDDWKHPVHGFGPLYVVDEAHKVLRRGHTKFEVDEWYAEHRHALCDVIIVTQSLGKVSKPIVDNSQIVYRVRKAVAMGKPDHYIRKVQDGPRGEVMDTSVRKYEEQYYRFYKSHTRADGGMEALAFDINPAYKRWFRYSFMLIGFAAIAAVFKLVSADDEKPSTVSARTEEHAGSARASHRPDTNRHAGTNYAETSPTPEPTPTPDPREKGPFAHLGIHIAGQVTTESGKTHYLFVLTQNGQRVRHLSSSQLSASGYRVEPQGDCAAKIHYQDYWQFASCDYGTVALKAASVTRRN